MKTETPTPSSRLRELARVHRGDAGLARELEAIAVQVERVESRDEQVKRTGKEN